MGWFSSGESFYCVKCKEKVESDDYTEIKNPKNGRTMLVCIHDCGTKMCRFT